MENVTIPQEKLTKAYEKGTPEERKLLESLFDKDKLVSEEELDTVAKCEKQVGRCLADIFSADFLKKGRSFIVACAELEIIAEAYNGGIIDFADTTQKLWFPYVNRVSGCGLSLNGVGYYVSFAFVAPRLCFKEKALAEKAFKKFPEVFEAYFKGVVGK